MPGFVRCLTMPAGFDAVALYRSALRCPVWACLFIYVFSIDRAQMSCLWEKRLNKRGGGKGIRPFYSVIEDTKKRRNVQERAD